MREQLAERVQQADQVQPVQVRERGAAGLGGAGGVLRQGQGRVQALLLQQRGLVLTQRAQQVQRAPHAQRRAPQRRVQRNLRRARQG